MDYSPQASLSMQFSRQGYWSGLPCPPPGNLHDPRIKLVSPAGRFFTTEPPEKSNIIFLLQLGSLNKSYRNFKKKKSGEYWIKLWLYHIYDIIYDIYIYTYTHFFGYYIQKICILKTVSFNTLHCSRRIIITHSILFKTKDVWSILKAAQRRIKTM